jgi:hypothetical protein
LREGDFMEEAIGAALLGDVLRAIGIEDVSRASAWRYQVSEPVKCSRSALVGVSSPNAPGASHKNKVTIMRDSEAKC